MNFLITTLIVIFSILCVSCNKCEVEDDDIRVLRITSDINISIDTFFGQLVLISKTEKLYGYPSLYDLIAEIEKSDNNYEIYYKCIEKASGLAQATIGSATHVLEFENINYEEVINLTFKLKGRKYVGHIKNGTLSLEKEGLLKLGD